MKFTSNERLIVENFKPYKVIDIYRNSKLIYTLKTDDTTENLADLKRKYRHELKTAIAHSGKRLKRLAVADDSNNYYSLAYCNYYRNIADEYATMKRLKEQLECEHPDTIRVETATSKKDYHKQFKIVYVNWVA